MKELIAFIRAVKAQKGLLATDIVARSGGKITDSGLSGILKGKTKSITLDTILALAEGMEVEAVEVFRAAAGERVDVENGDPWPGRVLIKTMQKIMDSPDLTAIVKALVDLAPAKVSALRRTIERQGRKTRSRGAK